MLLQKISVIPIRTRILPAAALAVLLSCTPSPTPAPYNPPTPVIDHQPTLLEIAIETPASAERLRDPRPNIILILTDDQPWHTVDYMPAVKNTLMANGVVFENGFVTTPLCCPSRVSILSGQYVHNHQVYTNTMPQGGAPKFDESDCVAIWLQQAGYRTAYFGKYLNAYEDLVPYGYVPPGWDEWNAFLGKNISPDDDVGHLQYYFDFSMSENGKPVEYPRSKENFSADVITNNALRFIRDARDQPFFMTVGYYNPHSPYVAAPRHRDAFRASTNWDWVQYRPPDFNEADIRDKPDYLGDLSPLSEGEIDTAHKQILRSLLSVDDGVASMLAALKQAGLNENTILVYTSDNGLTLGDHRFGVTKNCPYEACIKVPFIVYGPGYFPARRETRLVANIDLAPTFAEWAGMTPPKSVDGMSLASLLDDPSAAWREEILLEHWPTEQGVGSMIPAFSSVRTKQWKYTEYETGETELYDLLNDPFELTNLARKWDYKEIREELVAKLERLLSE